MGINHSGFNVFVFEQFLDGADIIAVFKEVCGEAVAKNVGGNVFVNSCQFIGSTNRFLDTAITDVLSPFNASAGVFGKGTRWKYPLLDTSATLSAGPFFTGVRIFSVKSIRHVHSPMTFR